MVALLSRSKLARTVRAALMLVSFTALPPGCSDEVPDDERFVATARLRQRPAPDKIRRSKRPLIEPIGNDDVFTVARTLHVDDDGPKQPLFDAAATPGSEHNPYTSIQQAADTVRPGDTVMIHEGTYDSGTTSRAVPVIDISRSGTSDRPITYRATAGAAVVLSGGGDRTDILVRVRASHIVIENIELTRARRAAIVIDAPVGHNVTVRRCYAHHNNGDDRWIGAAFRTVGPVHHILFEECISHDNSSGFQLRESPNQTAATAFVPPSGGNTGYASDLPEEEWDDWAGWTAIAPRRVTIRRCIAYDNRLIDEHSDGFGLRYGIECTFEDNIAFRNTDDGFDLLGATRCITRRNIAFSNDPENTENGDGNGIKIGVRGGLDNIVHHNIAFDNERGGIDMGDTERPVVINNTCFANRQWFGIWCEGGRSHAGVTLLNNIATDNPKGDIGLNGGVAVDQFDHNLVSDANDHNWAADTGPGGFINTDPLYLNPIIDIDTTFPAGLSIADKVAYIRDQVHAKLGLAPASPAIDSGTHVDGINDDYAGSAPDIGALEY